MGTNYYLRTAACPHCGHRAADLHIGKSSAGWYFGLRIYSEGDPQLSPFGAIKIQELADWQPLFEKFTIVDEYDQSVSASEMLFTITEREHPRGLLSRLTAGPAHMGPHSTLDQMKAGAGTYDLCNYEFS